MTTETEIEKRLREVPRADPLFAIAQESADTIARLTADNCARVPVEFFGSPRKIRARIGDWRLQAVLDTPANGVAIYVYAPPFSRRRKAKP